MSTQIEILRDETAVRRLPLAVGRVSARYLLGVLVLAGAYYGAAKGGQALRYTGSVAAIWPPAGLGIAALYLWGVRWWPGVLLGEFVVNAELLFGSDPLPLGSLVGQQLGNMAEIVVGAVLLRRLLGPRAELDRTEQVARTFTALAVATAISATAGTLAMRAGQVITSSEMLTFWRTWWLGDLTGALTVAPLLLVWARRPRAAWRRICTFEGICLLAAVPALAALTVSTEIPVSYLVFPVLIAVAVRLRAQGGTLAVFILAGTTIGLTAHHLGPFARQAISSRTLGTQLYVLVAALTTLLLAALVGERERSTAALVEAKRREGEQALEERHRIGRELHDSVSQALFSTVLQTRIAEKALRSGDVGRTGSVAQALATIGDLTHGVQAEMRSLIFDLRRDPVENGLVAALREYAQRACGEADVRIEVFGPVEPLPISHAAAAELFGIGREALSNVVKHARASSAWARVELKKDLVLLEVRDDGCGFDPDHRASGHYGLESMQGRANEIGATLSITSSAALGTAVRVSTPIGTAGNGA
jgi:signal transduction histidine kinase